MQGRELGLYHEQATSLWDVSDVLGSRVFLAQPPTGSSYDGHVSSKFNTFKTSKIQKQTQLHSNFLFSVFHNEALQKSPANFQSTGIIFITGSKHL